MDQQGGQAVIPESKNFFRSIGRTLLGLLVFSSTLSFSYANDTVASGIGHSLFIKSDGSLWAMGQNNLGQLGDGTTTDRNSPVKIEASGVSWVATSSGASFYLKSDGSLWAMGGGYGNTPAQIEASGVTAVDAGGNHSLYVKSDGSLWAMGQNNYGQLGDGTTSQRASPVQVEVSGVTAVDAGGNHSLYVKSDGSLWAMGRNYFGQLGDGTNTDRNSPVQIESSGVVLASAGEGGSSQPAHSLYVKSDGSLWGMGNNSYGQLGDGSQTHRSTPVQVQSSGVTAIAVGYIHSLFLKSDGSLWGMGNNYYGAVLGNPSLGPVNHTPFQLESSGVSSVAASMYTTLYMKSNGNLWGMGRNNTGQLGDGTTTQRTWPVQTNTPPSDLNFTAALAFSENQPIGTVVGEFNATDPDANATLTYYLVSGAGDGNNSLFTLETNGTLKTATTFDYESNASTYYIRVQAKDEYNATVEGYFTVTLTDDPADNPVDLTNGLVAWYPFDGNASDMSGNGNHGTVNGATLGTNRHGQENKAYRFDGVDDWIEVNHHPSIDFDNADSFTLSLWLKFGVGNTNYRSIIEKWSGFGAYSHVLRHSDTSHIYFNRWDGSSADRLDITEDEFPQIFQHVIVTSNGSRLSLFLNLLHKQSVSISTGSTSNTSNLFFGKRGGSSTYNFSGWLDEVRLYDRALSASELLALYEMESALPAQSVSSAKLSPAMSDLIDGNGSIEQALPAGSVIARKPGEGPPPSYTLFQRNEYNASLDWEEKGLVSVARYAGDGLVNLNGKIYFIGGYHTTPVKTFERYDPNSDEWETLPDLQDAREGLASAVLDGKIYAIGGAGLSSVEIFDPTTNQWSYGPSLPEALDRACALSVNGKIILTGGRLGGVDLQDVYEFDPSRATWETLSPLSYPRSAHRMVFSKGRIWVLGGNSVICESYNLVTDTWRDEAALNTARSWAVAWSSGGDLFMGGGNSPGSDSVEILREGAGQWVSHHDKLPVPRYGADAIVHKDKVYIVAGKYSGSYSRKVYAADLPTPEMNLYFKEGNATAEAELSTLGIADGSVTLGQLAPDALTKLGLDHNPATTEGNLLAIPRGDKPQLVIPSINASIETVA